MQHVDLWSTELDQPGNTHQNEHKSVPMLHMSIRVLWWIQGGGEGCGNGAPPPHLAFFTFAIFTHGTYMWDPCPPLWKSWIRPWSMTLSFKPGRSKLWSQHYTIVHQGGTFLFRLPLVFMIIRFEQSSQAYLMPCWVDDLHNNHVNRSSMLELDDQLLSHPEIKNNIHLL